MFDHVVFSVSDYAASKAFFLKALEPLGIAIASEGELGVEFCCTGSTASLCIRRVEINTSVLHPLHLAFKAENRQQVDAFHKALSNRVRKITEPQGFDLSITQTIMAHLLLALMATISK